MGISLANIDLGGVLKGIGTLAKDVRSAVTGEISPEKKAEIEARLIELEFLSSKAQTDINLVEALNPNLFVSGWRPAVGWTCAGGVFWHFIGNSIFTWAVALSGSNIKAPEMNTEGLISLVMALLGMGTLRMLERVKGVARS